MFQEVDDRLGHVACGQLPRFGLGLRRSGEAGADGPRYHAAYADVVVTNFLHQHFTQGVETSLRSAVRRPADKRMASGEAADVDDPSTTAASQHRNCRVARKEDAAQIRLNDCLPVFDRHFVDLSKTPHTGIVDKNVKLTKYFDSSGDCRLHMRRFANISRERFEPTTTRIGCALPGRLAYRLRELISRTATDQNVNALCDERLGDCQPDPS